MPTEVILPRVDMDMTEGSIAAWHVSEGDEVRAGTVIFEIETSKATMEVDAPASGVIRQISAPVGTTVPVGTPVAWIYAAGEAVVEPRSGGGDVAATGGPGDAAGLATASAVVDAAEAPEHAPERELTDAERAPRSAAESHAVDPAATTTGTAAKPEPEPARSDQPVRATPAARRLARERGLQLVSIAGSGPQGRIAAQDVLRLAHGATSMSTGSASAAAPAGVDTLHTLWLQRGRGETLVLLHGFAAESNSWRPFAQALKRVTGDRFGLLAIDLPAHGKSADTSAGSLDAIVAAVGRTLLAEGVTHCHLVGHSFGAAIALALAAGAQAGMQASSWAGLRASSQAGSWAGSQAGSQARSQSAAASQPAVRSLALFAPAGLGPESNGAFLRGVTTATRRESLAPWLRQLFADPTKMDDAFIATAAQQLQRADVRERLAVVGERFFPDGTQALDLREALTQLAIPTRIVWGLQDRILPVRHADGVPGWIAVHRFAGVGHLPQIEAQDEVARLVVANVAGADTESAQEHAAIG